MHDRAVVAMARRAAQAWGGCTHPPRVIVTRENSVCEVRLRSGWHGALRLHRPGYQTAGAIDAELRWMESLADAGFACPWPLRTGADDLVIAVPDGPLASLVQWIDAAPIAGSAPDADLMRNLGALLADLHLTADMTAPEGLDRPAWDARALCCTEAPRWGRFWTNPSLTPEEAALLCTARDAAHARLLALGDAGCGLIHGDVLPENVLARDGRLYLIDFDDCGWGYRLHDLATALIRHVDLPGAEARADALWLGYRDAGGPLTDEARADLPLFVMLRAMASAGWIIDRAADDDPRQRLYAARAVALADAYLAA